MGSICRVVRRRKPMRRWGRRASLGVSPGLPLRTLAAGHPGPRSLGDPLRFGPPGVARSSTPEGHPRAHPSLTGLRTACPPQERRPAAGAWGGGCASGTGPRAAERPRQSRGAFGTRGPVPFSASRSRSAFLGGLLLRRRTGTLSAVSSLPSSRWPRRRCCSRRRLKQQRCRALGWSAAR